jgi:hypothetical protein
MKKIEDTVESLTRELEISVRRHAQLWNQYREIESKIYTENAWQRHVRNRLNVLNGRQPNIVLPNTEDER